MTIYVTRLAAGEDSRVTIRVLLDGQEVARLSPGTSADIYGSGRQQMLWAEGFKKRTAPRQVTDAGERRIGFKVSFVPFRGLLSRRRQPLEITAL